MGDARVTTGTQLLARVNYELRNASAVEWIAAEMLEYINKWLEFTYMILAEAESDIVMTGSGSFVTVAGTERYSLATNSMGDLWYIPGCLEAENSNVRISGTGGLLLGERNERTPHLIAKDNGTGSYTQPNKFYLHQGYIGLLPFPDAVYTIYIQDYVPNFVPLTLITETIPFQNLFNLQLEEGAKIIAKGREGYGSGTDAVLMELFQDRAVSILRKRQKQNNRFTG